MTEKEMLTSALALLREGVNHDGLLAHRSHSWADRAVALLSESAPEPAPTSGGEATCAHEWRYTIIPGKRVCASCGRFEDAAPAPASDEPPPVAEVVAAQAAEVTALRERVEKDVFRSIDSLEAFRVDHEKRLTDLERWMASLCGSPGCWPTPRARRGE